jgi:hypothetical protein
MNNLDLDVAARRQLVFASLLRYAPTSVPLRDRIIDQLTIAGLVGSSAEGPYSVGKILGNVFAGSKNSLRPERIQEALERLRSEALVEATEARKKHAYYLLPKGEERAQQSVAGTEDVFEKSLGRVLNGIEYCCSIETATKVCRDFLLECFSRFGVQMAKSVTGQIQPSDLLKQADVQAAFLAAAAKSEIPKDAVDSLYARCREILKSSHPDDVRLRFLITQGYYFAQLAEYGDSVFNPLLLDTYSGSCLLLDTNVLLLAVEGIVRKRLFAELQQVAKQLKMRLLVTRATLSETLKVLQDHRHDLAQVVAKVPDSLLQLSGDELTDAYLEAVEAGRAKSVEEFFGAADAQLLEIEKHFDVSELNEDVDSMLSGQRFPDAEQIIQEEAVRSRGWEKSPPILMHDVAHFAYVTRERANNAKLWFLTRDRGLPFAAARLAQADHRPFTFDLTVLLESVSPFLSSSETTNDLAQVLANLISENLMPRTAIMNLHELKLLVEMHEDVLSTPPEQLIQAVDYVKHMVLHGDTYKPAKYNEVALGLKSFIASSADDQRRELMEQRARVEADLQKQVRLATEERNKREAQEAIIANQLTEIEELQGVRGQQTSSIEALSAKVAAQTSQITSLEAFRKSVLSFVAFAQWAWLIISFLIMVLVARTEQSIAGYVQWKFKFDGQWDLLRTIAKLIPAASFVAASAILTRRRPDWPFQGRASITAIAILISMIVCRFFDTSVAVYTLTSWMVLIATAIVTIFEGRNRQ